MMLIPLLLAVSQPATSADQVAVLSFQQCLSPIVAANERLSERDYVRFDDLFAKVKSVCAEQRLAAREALASYVASVIAAEEGRTMPPGGEWKEELINDATIRWMNSALHQVAAEMDR